MIASDKLRQLVNKATPGPWVTIDARIGNRAWVQVGPARNQTVIADVVNLTDAHLIALAPQLAELVADMAELMENDGSKSFEEGFIAKWLTRLDALFEKETA